MAHWHDFNPWAANLVYLPSILEALGEAAENRIFADYGQQVDLYLLRSPEGAHSCGIRYGRELHEYLSPAINAAHAETLLRKYSEENTMEKAIQYQLLELQGKLVAKGVKHPAADLTFTTRGDAYIALWSSVEQRAFDGEYLQMINAPTVEELFIRALTYIEELPQQ